MQRQQAWEKLNSKINNENIEHVYWGGMEIFNIKH
jgi:hypothetical protein